MRKVISALLTSLVSIVFLLTFSSSAFASVTATHDPAYADIDSKFVKIIFTSNANDFVSGKDYSVAFFKNTVAPVTGKTDCGLLEPEAEQIQWVKPSNDGKTITATFNIIGEFRKPQKWAYAIWADKGCTNYKTDHLIPASPDSFIIYPPGGNPTTGIPAIRPKNSCSNFQIGTSAEFLIQNAQPNTNYTIWIDGQSKNPPVQFTPTQIIDTTATYQINIGNEIKESKVCLSVGGNTGCDYSTSIATEATNPVTCRPITQSNQPGIPLYISPEKPEPSAPPAPCKDLVDGKCLKVSTAIGDIGTNPTAFIKDIFSILLGVSGGIALILIIISGYRLMASQGNPEKVQEAREMLTSAVVGLLFIIFSLVILQIIGVSILQIPGFSP